MLGWGVDRVGDVLRAERAEAAEDGMDMLETRWRRMSSTPSSTPSRERR